MRTFTLGQGSQRRYVVIDVQGTRMAVTHGKPDATPTRQEKTLASEAEVRKAADIMVKELLARGFVEQTSSGPKVHPAVKTPPGPPIWRASLAVSQPESPEIRNPSICASSRSSKLTSSESA